MIRSKLNALTPRIVKPMFRMASTQTPRKPPMIVPDPPISDVPPMTAAATARNMMSVPPWSGRIDVIRVESRIPAKPPSTLQSTKLPILIHRTLTPLSLAPIALPPVATVWTPHLRPHEHDLQDHDG